MSGEPIVFGGGLPDPALHPDLGEIMAQVMVDEPDTLSYGGPWGDASLRDLIATRLSSRASVSLDADNVIITNGSAGAIELAARCFVHPGTTVAVEELTYPGALQILRERGAQVLPVPIDHDGMVLTALEDRGAGTRPLVIYSIATCHSPTGTVMSDGRRHQLVELVQSSSSVVIQDDTYGEIFFEDPAPRLLIGLDPQNVIHVGSFSKTLAPGLRLGWLAGPKAVIGRIAAMRTDLGSPAVIQKTVARLMRDGRFDRHLRRAVPFYRSKRDSLVAALDDCCAGLGQWNIPRGGFFTWFVLTSGDVDAVAQAAMKEGVRFLSGPYFSSHKPDRRGIRLAYGELSSDELVEGAHRFSRAIERSQREAIR